MNLYGSLYGSLFYTVWGKKPEYPGPVTDETVIKEKVDGRCWAQLMVLEDTRGTNIRPSFKIFHFY